MDFSFRYTAEDHCAALPVADYIARFRDAKRFLECCRACRNYGRSWGCRSFAYVGTCLYCPEGTCTRPEAKPCRHPELVRPSLEACGFDIAHTTSELFGIELKWGTDGSLPEYLTLVCGFFHNAENIIWNG